MMQKRPRKEGGLLLDLGRSTPRRGEGKPFSSLGGGRGREGSTGRGQGKKQSLFVGLLRKSAELTGGGDGRRRGLFLDIWGVEGINVRLFIGGTSGLKPEEIVARGQVSGGREKVRMKKVPLPIEDRLEAGRGNGRPEVLS